MKKRDFLRLAGLFLVGVMTTIAAETASAEACPIGCHLFGHPHSGYTCICGNEKTGLFCQALDSSTGISFEVHDIEGTEHSSLVTTRLSGSILRQGVSIYRNYDPLADKLSYRGEHFEFDAKIKHLKREFPAIFSGFIYDIQFDRAVFVCHFER